MPPGIPRFRAARVGRVKVAAEAARRFLVARHFLAPARSVAGGLDGVLEVFRTFGSIQFDPIAVAGRNHDLVLHARVAGYEPAWCDLLYERREILETTTRARWFISGRGLLSVCRGYGPAGCDLLYERREIFETTNKPLSFIPALDAPWFRLGFGRKVPRLHSS